MIEETELNQKPKRKSLVLRGVDADESNYSLFTQIQIYFLGQKESFILKKEPMKIFLVRLI